MSFEHYRVVLSLLSPLHIGKRKYRNLMETRDYVPGRTLWGALTARIVRDYFDGKPNLYEKIGDYLNENLRFGYLWPSLDGKKPYFPWEYKDFDYLLKSGYMGQPLDYIRHATEEGQLHEVEFIAPKTKDGRQVYLIGDLWIKESNIQNLKINGKKINLCQIFDNLQLGGERNYGWGRVECKSITEINNKKAIGDVKIVTDTEEVVLKFKAGSYLTAHALAVKWDDLEPVNNSFVGQVEPFTGYAWGCKKDNSSKKEGWHLLPPPICYVPGSKVQEETKVKIGKFGILEKL